MASAFSAPETSFLPLFLSGKAVVPPQAIRPIPPNIITNASSEKAEILSFVMRVSTRPAYSGSTAVMLAVAVGWVGGGGATRNCCNAPAAVLPETLSNIGKRGSNASTSSSFNCKARRSTLPVAPSKLSSVGPLGPAVTDFNETNIWHVRSAPSFTDVQYSTASVVLGTLG